MTLTWARVTFDPHIAAAQTLFSNAQRMHGFTMRAVGTPDPAAADGDKAAPARQAAGLLWRTDLVRGTPTLLVQMDGTPCTDEWQAAPEVADVTVVSDVAERLASRIQPGAEVRFMLRANATRYEQAPGHGARGKKRNPILGQEALIEWLARQGEGAFTLPDSPFGGGPDVVVEQEAAVRVDPRGAVFSSTSFKGTLTVTEPARLQALVATGVGRGRAFGFGLLRVA